MKQVAQTQNDGRVRLVEVPVPAVHDNSVLIQTAFSVISAGTERAKLELAQKSLLGKARSRPEQAQQVLLNMRTQGVTQTIHKVRNRLRSLAPLGYSASGVIHELGRSVDGLTRGETVACAGAGWANHAEYNVVPANLVVKLPEGVPLHAGAFGTVGSIALQGVRLTEPQLAENIVVIGLGLLGLIATQLLQCAGCNVMGIDVSPNRVAMAKDLGADEALLASDVSLESSLRRMAPRGADAVIVTAASRSNGPLQLAGRLAREKGRIVLVGDVPITLPRAPYYNKELEFRISRSYGPGRYDPDYEEKGRDYPFAYVRWTEQRNIESFLQLVGKGRINLDRLITHRFPIDDVDKAYELLEGKTREPYLGVLLEYPQPAVAPTSGDKPTPLAIAPRTMSAPQPRADQLVAGFIGAGNFMQDVLLPAFRATGKVTLQSVATQSGLSARSALETFGFKKAATADEIIADPEINLVVIATRHDSHARLASLALKAGKHVFVEKPLALDQQQLEEVVEAYCGENSGQAGARLMVGYNRRFAPVTIAARDFVKSTRSSMVINVRVNAGYLAAERWEQDREIGGGRIIGEGCHFVDLVGYLVGQRVTDIDAWSLPDEGRYRHDNVVSVLRYDDESIATIHYLANGVKGFPKERVEIFGGGRIAVIDDFRTATLVDARGTKTVGSRWTQDKGHRNEVYAFVDSILSASAPPISFEDIVGSTSTTFAIVDAITERRILPK